MATTNILLQRLTAALAAITSATRIWKLILLLLVIAVGYLALTPAPPASIDTGWDKLNHVLAFTALAFSGYLGLPASRGRRILLLLALLGLGGAIEILQLFVPGRASEWGDLFADSIGIACGALIATCVLLLASRKFGD